MIQSLIIKTLSLLAIALLATACTSTDSGTVTEQGAASVPGEKVTSDTQVMPSTTTGGPSASIGW